MTTSIAPIDLETCTALEAAQYYLDWFHLRNRRAAKILVGMKSPLQFVIVCVEGDEEIEVDQRFHDQMCRVLARVVKERTTP